MANDKCLAWYLNEWKLFSSVRAKSHRAIQAWKTKVSKHTLVQLLFILIDIWHLHFPIVFFLVYYSKSWRIEQWDYDTRLKQVLEFWNLNQSCTNPFQRDSKMFLIRVMCQESLQIKLIILKKWSETVVLQSRGWVKKANKLNNWLLVKSPQFLP